MTTAVATAHTACCTEGRRRGNEQSHKSDAEEQQTKSASSNVPLGHNPGLLSDVGGVASWCSDVLNKEAADADAPPMQAKHRTAVSVPVSRRDRILSFAASCLPHSLQHQLYPAQRPGTEAAAARSHFLSPQTLQPDLDS